MAHGDNHAKKIVIDEATCLADKLQNGNAACSKTQGKAIALLVKMITPLYEAEFMTVDECKRVHRNGNGKKPITRLKIGTVEIEGTITTAIIANFMPLLCCGMCVYVVGKIQNWW